MNRRLSPTKSTQQIKEEQSKFLVEDVDFFHRIRRIQKSNRIKR